MMLGTCIEVLTWPLKRIVMHQATSLRDMNIGTGHVRKKGSRKVHQSRVLGELQIAGKLKCSNVVLDTKPVETTMRSNLTRDNDEPCQTRSENRLESLGKLGQRCFRTLVQLMSSRIA